MKTVTGGVIAVEPISLPKAAKILSGFISSENGSSQDVGAYLRRASAAFGELKSLHVELKSSPLKQSKQSIQMMNVLSPERLKGRDKVMERTQKEKEEAEE